MPKRLDWRLVPLLATSTILFGCAGTQPAPYSGVAAAAYMRPNASAKAPYMYTAEVNWSDYSKVILEAVDVYKGPDSQFGDMALRDRDVLADYMQTQFGEALSKRFGATQRPSRGALLIKLTLTGAARSKQVLSTLSRFDLAGGLYNNVQAVRGREGIMTGWVMYTVEIYDASSNTLLKAYEAKQYPNAINIKATVGSLSAAKTGIDKGAKMLVAELS